MGPDLVLSGAGADQSQQRLARFLSIGRDFSPLNRGVDVKAPAEFANAVEERPILPPGNAERVSGYGVMGLPFRSGHVLGLRRWTASSVGDRFTSIWHRDPAGSWSFYESVDCDVACSRYFGADVERARVVPINIDWESDNQFRVSTADGAVDWRIAVGSSPVTRLISGLGSRMPLALWRSRPMLLAMGATAGRMLGVGKVQLTGTTSNGQHFDANPLRIWRVTQSQATVEDEDLGPIGSLPEQAHMADFYFPQEGIFAMGRVFITPIEGRDKQSGSVNSLS